MACKESKLYLKIEVHGILDKRLYANQGDEVKLISDHGNVLIVEGMTGERFSVKTTDITTEEVKVKNEEPTPKATNNTVRRKATGKVTAPLNKKPEQSQLF